MFPKVSIVTPSFNQANFIESTIRSVLDQAHPNVEYIVLDGGSTDGTREILERWSPRLAYWRSEKDRGQVAAVNEGIGLATGEIVTFINSDDLLMPGSIEAALKMLSTSPTLDGVFGGIRYLDSEGKTIREYTYPPYYHWIAKRKAYIPQPGCFFTKSLWRRLGGFREDLSCTFDSDFFHRAILSGAHFATTSELWAGFRVHDDAKGVSEKWRDVYQREMIANRMEFRKTSGALDRVLANICYQALRYLRHRSNKKVPWTNLLFG